MNVTLAGLGYSHGWLSLQLTVTDGTRIVADCARELMNAWTWAGGYDDFHDVTPGPHVDLTATFDRVVTDPACRARYVASVQADVNGTYAGFAGCDNFLHARLASLEASGCP
jgi:hypothetical protein